MNISNIKIKEAKDDNIYEIVLMVEEAIVLSGMEAVYKDGSIELNLPDNIEFISPGDLEGFKKAILQDIECKMLCENTRLPKTFSELNRYVKRVMNNIKHHKY